MSPLEVRVAPFAPSLRELDDARVRRAFPDAGPQLRFHLHEFCGRASSFRNAAFVASAWEGERLRGVFGATRYDGTPQPILVIRPIAPLPERWRDAEDVVAALVEALIEACRAQEIGRLAVRNLDAELLEPIALLERLGFRAVASPPDHVLSLSAADDFEAYLATLATKRRWNFTNDLRRAPEAGASMRIESPPTPATLERAWVLQLDTFARKGGRMPLVAGEHNALAAIAERLPEQFVVACCVLDEVTLGFLGYFRIGTEIDVQYVGHVADPPLHVYSALFAEVIRAEIGRGARVLRLGPTGEQYKRRIGCASVAQVFPYQIVVA